MVFLWFSYGKSTLPMVFPWFSYIKTWRSSRAHPAAQVNGQHVPTAAIVSAAGGMTDALVSIINTSLVAAAEGRG